MRTMEHCPAVRKNEILTPATARMNLKNIKKKPGVKDYKASDSIYMKLAGKANLSRQKADWQLPGAGVERDSDCTWAQRFFWEDANIIKLDCGDGCTLCKRTEEY